MMFPSPQDFSSVLVFDAGTLIALLLLAGLLPRDRFAARLIFGGVAAAIILTYAAWRWHDTVPPLEWTIASIWPHVFFAFEATAIVYRAPRKIAFTCQTPQNCLRMIPLRSRSDSFPFTPGLSAIVSESNFSRCP